MSKKKLRQLRTPIEILVSNLRGEVGEIIYTWILVRDLNFALGQFHSQKIEENIKDPSYNRLNILIEKLYDEIISRLSELAEEKIGRLTFYFVSEKLSVLKGEVKKYNSFISKNKFKLKRNHEISHKECPETWNDFKPIIISYKLIVSGIVRALILMKKIDDVVLGLSSKYLWREMRKKRYEVINPVRVKYMIMPYIHLSKADRTAIVAEELKKNMINWEEIETEINKKKTKIKVYKKWAAIHLGDRILVLDKYPLISLKSLEIS